MYTKNFIALQKYTLFWIIFSYRVIKRYNLICDKYLIFLKFVYNF